MKGNPPTLLRSIMLASAILLAEQGRAAESGIVWGETLPQIEGNAFVLATPSGALARGVGFEPEGSVGTIIRPFAVRTEGASTCVKVDLSFELSITGPGYAFIQIQRGGAILFKKKVTTGRQVDVRSLCLAPNIEHKLMLIADSYSPSSGSGEAAATAAIAIQNTELEITFEGEPYSIDTAPKMPEIAARAAGPGVESGRVRWTARIEFDPTEYSEFALARNDLNLSSRPQVLPGTEPFKPEFKKLRGGKLIVSARLLRSGAAATAEATIKGNSPTPDELRPAYPPEYAGVLALIATAESGSSQFKNGYPYWSEDYEGGVGVFQITDPLPTADEVWNWRANAAAAVRKLRTVADLSDRYWRRVARSGKFKQLVKQYNLERQEQGLSALNIQPEPFTQGDFNGDYRQREMIAVRAYNGAAGVDPIFAFPLQEFMLATEQSGGAPRLIVRIVDDSQGFVGWVRVPELMRPQDKGDPAYVRKVLGF